jgi:ABC-type transport system involved in multi-copper enzyme maturation permease subunit
LRTTFIIASNLLARLFKRHRLFLAAIGLLLSGFQILICAIVANTNIGGAIQELSQSLPPFVQNFLSEELAFSIGSRGLLVFAWNHPVVHALLAAVMILSASRAIAGEIEDGTLELVLTQPISRPAYLTTQIVFTFFVLLVLIGLMLASVKIGLWLYNLQRVLSWQTFLPVAINLVSFEMAIYGVTLFLSSLWREAGRVVSVALMFMLVSYLLQAVARLWPAIQFLLHYTIFEYYSPQQIVLNGSISWRDIVVLLAVGFVTGGAGWWKFRRRDIP